MSSKDEIAEALFDALGESTPAALQKLHDAVRTFETKYSRSYNGVRRQPFARALLDAIDEAFGQYQQHTL